MIEFLSDLPPILVLSQREAESYQPRDFGEICISVTTSADVVLSDRFAAVLRLYFADIDLACCGPIGQEAMFQETHARQIVEFVRLHHAATRLVIHCHAGRSRSPAIALGLMDRYQEVPSKERALEWRDYNCHVRRVLVRYVDE